MSISVWMCSSYNASQSAKLHRLKIFVNWACLKLVLLAAFLRDVPFLAVFYLPTREVITFKTMDSFKEYNAKFTLLEWERTQNFGF